MDDFLKQVRKEIFTPIIHLESFQIGEVKYAVVITKLAWYACRLYCSYQLKVHKDSPLYRAVRREQFVPWSYSYKYKTDETLVFEKVELECRSQHFHLKGAQNRIQELKEQCEAGRFAKNEPEYYKYFAEFCNPEEEPVTDRFESIIQSDPEKFDLCRSQIIDKTQADQLVNGLIFPDRTIVKTMRLNDILTFDYYGTPSIVIYSRTFYHIEGVPYSDGNSSLSLHHKHEYSYNKTFCCFVQKSKDKLDLVKKSDELDFSFLKNFIKRQWDLIFDPPFFYDYFTNRITHKKKWSTLSPSELNESIQMGSILRITRKSGAYFHAGVYLGFDLVIHVSIRKSDFVRKREIFTFETFENFVQNSGEVEEIRFLVPRFTREELYERAVKMNKEEVAYKLVENNCEHLASLLTTGMKYSLQLGNPVRKFVAKLIGDGFETANSLS